MLRRCRRILSLLFAAALMLAQLSVAAYACPRLLAEAVTPVSTCCPQQLDPAAPALCLAHCLQGAQGNERAAEPAPLVAALPAPCATSNVVRPRFALIGRSPCDIREAHSPPERSRRLLI